MHGNGQGLVILARTFATTDNGPWGKDCSAMCSDTELYPPTGGIRKDHRKWLMGLPESAFSVLSSLRWTSALRALYK